MIDKYSNEIGEENLIKFIQSLEHKLTIDWFKFPSNSAKVKLEIKRFFQMNGIDRGIIDDLVELFLEELITESKKVSEASFETVL